MATLASASTHQLAVGHPRPGAHLYPLPPPLSTLDAASTGHPPSSRLVDLARGRPWRESLLHVVPRRTRWTRSTLPPSLRPAPFHPRGSTPMRPPSTGPPRLVLAGVRGCPSPTLRPLLAPSPRRRRLRGRGRRPCRLAAIGDTPAVVTFIVRGRRRASWQRHGGAIPSMETWPCTS